MLSHGSLTVQRSIAFGVTLYTKTSNAAGVLEWVVAFIFTFYMLSFFFDLRPKARTKEQFQRETAEYNNSNENVVSTFSTGQRGTARNF